MKVDIRTARQKRGWTQKRLADESGVDVATIARIEQRRTGTLVETLGRIAKALEVDARDLLVEEEAETTTSTP